MTNIYWDGENWLEVLKDDEFIEYYFGEKKHRKDGPAFLSYHPNGNIETMIYWFNDEIHNKNEPALLSYYANGNIRSKEYYFNGELHRKDGPARIIFYENGKIFIEDYYYNNIKFDPKDLPFELPIDTEEKKLFMKLKYGE